MASSNYLQKEKVVQILSPINQTKERSEETINQKEIYIRDMKKERRKPEEDQISDVIEPNNSNEKTNKVSKNNQHVVENSSVHKSVQQQNPQRLVATKDSSNKDSGISGSSNESVSQIPSPVEEEGEIKNEDTTDMNSK